MFDWRKYYTLAQCLIGEGDEFDLEAGFRCATSRAYYSSFCYSRNFAQNKLRYMPSRDYSDHESLRRHLSSHNLDNISRKLDRLRQWRNSCDYDNEVANLDTITRTALKEANYILQCLRQ